MTFWWRFKMVLAIYLGMAVALLTVGVVVAWALVGPCLVWLSFLLNEWLTWRS